MHDSLNKRFAHLWVEKIKLSGIVPRHISTIVSMINISDIACITINSLENYSGILFE